MQSAAEQAPTHQGAPAGGLTSHPGSLRPTEIPEGPSLILYKERLLEQANRRWRSAIGRHPDLAPAVELQRRVISRQLDLGEALDRGALIRTELAVDRATERHS